MAPSVITPGPVRVRRANIADAADLVRLRAWMLQAMGREVGDERAAWREAALAWFTERLAVRDRCAAFVVDDPELGVVASAVGVCDGHAPSPGSPTGLHGHVFNISTDRRRRRLGHARACLVALLAWFEQDTPARVIDLNATGDGIELYRSMGFTEPRFPALQLRMVARPAED
jgi:ribosomal protein S18 acetylase RimI-like enzyme